MCSLDFSSSLKSYIDAIIPTDSPEDLTTVAVVEDTDEVISEEERASQVWAELVAKAKAGQDIRLLKQQAEQAGVVDRDMSTEELTSILARRARDLEEACLARIHSRLLSAEVKFASTPGENLSGRFWTHLHTSAHRFKALVGGQVTVEARLINSFHSVIREGWLLRFVSINGSASACSASRNDPLWLRLAMHLRFIETTSCLESLLSQPAKLRKSSRLTAQPTVVRTIESAG